MSEINSYCQEHYWGEIFPGIHLIQGGKNKNNKDFYKAPNGVYMEEGRFGLTISNDPFVIFTEEPVEGWSISDEEIENMSDDDLIDYHKNVVNVGESYHRQLKGDIQNMGMLWEACVKSGYNKKRHGYIGGWLCEKIAQHIEEVKEPKYDFKSI